MRDGEGDEKGIVNGGEDIWDTDRYRITLDNLLEGCQVITHDWRYLYLNNAAVRHSHRLKNELIGKTMMECFPSIETTAMFGELQRCERERVASTIENEFLYPDGTSGWFELRIEPIPEGLFVLSIDITGRKLAEKRESALLSRIQEVASHIPGFIFQYSLTPEGRSRIIYASDGFREIFGVAPDTLTDDASMMFSVIHAEDRERVTRRLQDSARLQLRWNDSYRIIRPGGKTIWVEGSATPRPLDDGSTLWTGCIIDISERKRLDEQNLRLQRMESVGSLAGGIIHDMNNILGPIILSISLLRKKFNDPAADRMLDLLGTNSQRAAELIKQILMFARGSTTSLSPLALNLVVDEIKEVIRHTFPSSISCTSQAPRDLWMIQGDVTQIHQVLMNLSLNARDAMPRGGTLTFVAENATLDEHYARMFVNARPGSYVLLRVRDTGTGIPPELRSKIFDPFFSTKEIGKGTGLGLSTVFSIVKGHGGFLDVYSEVGRGTEFKISFPATASEQVDILSTAMQDTLQGRGELILVVDDDAAVCQISKGTLETSGYRVLTAHDGTEAIGLYAKHESEISLIITDLDMPYMDGSSLARALRQINPEVRIIGSSGMFDSNRSEDVVVNGMNSFLVKPYTAETFLKRIKEVLGEGKAS